MRKRSSDQALSTHHVVQVHDPWPLQSCGKEIEGFLGLMHSDRAYWGHIDINLWLYCTLHLSPVTSSVFWYAYTGADHLKSGAQYNTDLKIFWTLSCTWCYADCPEESVFLYSLAKRVSTHI
jgi:hypothetical protein